MSPVGKHIHRLKKHTYKKSGLAVYFCTLPDCSYKIEYQFALGKESLCNICGKPFIVNEYTLKLIKPHCPNCGRKEVKLPDGSRHYVRLVSTNIVNAIAADETGSLKDRLNKLTTNPITPLDPSPVIDEDI